MIEKPVAMLLYEWARTRGLGVRPLPMYNTLRGHEVMAHLRDSASQAIAQAEGQGDDLRANRLRKFLAMVDYFAEAARGRTDKRRFGWGSLKWAVWGLRDGLEDDEEATLHQALDAAMLVPREQWHAGAFADVLQEYAPGTLDVLMAEQEYIRAYRPMEAEDEYGRRVAIVTVARNMVSEMLGRHRRYDWYIGAPNMRVTVVVLGGERTAFSPPQEEALEALGATLVHPNYAVWPRRNGKGPRLSEVLDALGMTLIRVR